MTEQLRLHETRPPLTESKLLALGQLCLTNQAETSTLEDHTELSPNPNTLGQFAVPFGSGDIPTEPGKLYRQVGIEAVEDLATSDIVRNGATARGEEHKRWGHKVFWSEGQEGVHISTGGRAVIVVPKSAAEEGWVTSDKVEAIYTKTPAGKLINLLSRSKT